MNSTSFLAFSCPHCPLEDANAIKWLLGKIEAEKPAVVIHLGDGHEADSASRWPSEYDWELADEFKAHNDLLASIRKVAPKARKVFLPGNHDANLSEWNRIDKKLRGLCDYHKQEPELEHWEQPCKYEYDRRSGCFRLGQVTFSHGYEANQSGDEFQSILLGVPFGLFIGGHTHRPTPGIMRASKTAAVPLPFWYANPGCMRDLKPQYMKRKRSHQWGQGVVIGEAMETKSPRMSRMWDARVETFRLSGDEGWD